MPRSLKTVFTTLTVAVAALWLVVAFGAFACAQTGSQPSADSVAPPAVTGAPTADSSAPVDSAPSADVTRESDSPSDATVQPGEDSVTEMERQAAAPPSMQLAISSSSVDFGGGALNPRETPYTQSLTATINSNRSWRILVTKDGDLHGATQTIPSSDFTFSATGPAGRTIYQAPAGTQFGTDIRVVDGTRGSNLTTTVSYSLRVPWELEPDNYSAVHTYTALQI